METGRARAVNDPATPVAGEVEQPADAPTFTAMSDERINLVLEHLRALRADLGSMREMQIEHGMKLNRLGESLAGVKPAIALQAEHLAHVEVSLDQIRGDIGLIERHLQLTEA